MTIERVAIDAVVNDQRPSPTVIRRAIDAIREAYPEYAIEEVNGKAAHLTQSGAFMIDGDGNLGVRPTHVDAVRRLVPKLLGEDPAARKPTRVERAKANEQILTDRLAASRKPAKRPEPIEERLAEAVAGDAGLQGSSSLAKARRAALREKLWRASFAEAGLPFGRLDFNGVGT